MGRHFAEKGHFEHRPLYEELAEEFYRRITVGRWPVGRPLKTEVTIASEFGVSLGTVRRAFDRLEEFNLIDRTPGRGTIVRELDCQRRLAALTNIVDPDGEPVNGEIEIGEVLPVPASEAIASELAIEPGVSVARIERTRSFAGSIFAVETAYQIMVDATLPGRDALQASARFFIVTDKIAVKRREYARVVKQSEVGPIAQFLENADPLIEIRRTLLSFDETPLEHCLSYCQLGRSLRYRIC